MSHVLFPALSNLLCASLSEDPYGVVQGDIPKVLEAFVLYLMALETLSKSFLSGLEEGRVEKLNMEKQLEGSVGLIEEGKLFSSLTDSKLHSPRGTD